MTKTYCDSCEAPLTSYPWLILTGREQNMSANADLLPEHNVHFDLCHKCATRIAKSLQKLGLHLYWMT